MRALVCALCALAVAGCAAETVTGQQGEGDPGEALEAAQSASPRGKADHGGPHVELPTEARVVTDAAEGIAGVDVGFECNLWVAGALLDYVRRDPELAYLSSEPFRQDTASLSTDADGVAQWTCEIPEFRGLSTYVRWGWFEYERIVRRGELPTGVEGISTPQATIGGQDPWTHEFEVERVGPVRCVIEQSPGDFGFPERLSETGCFAEGDTPVESFVPFTVNSPLWMDGATKRRFIQVPEGDGLDYTADGSWETPDGTVVIKTFYFEEVTGDPATRRPAETRFLIKRAAGDWDAFTYQWLEDGSDAELRPENEGTVGWPITNADGEPDTYAHLYPSREQCIDCHRDTSEEGPGRLLGLQTAQLNLEVERDGVLREQLAFLSEQGVVDGLPDAPAEELPALVDPRQGPAPVDDDTASIIDRSSAYMEANCAHCHQPDGFCADAGLDLRQQTPFVESGLCTVVTPGDPEGSLLFRLFDDGAMPLFGRLEVDPAARELLREWVTRMPAAACGG